jgi:putative heme transporter
MTPGRGTAIGAGLTWTARWSLRLILATAGLVLVWLLIAQLWSIVLPVLLAVILATVLWPPTNWLRRRRFPPALAAGISLLAALVVLAGLITVVSTSVSGSLGQIAQSASAGITAIQTWLAGPPLNLAQSQLDDVITSITTQLQQSISTISTSVLAGVSGFASGVVTAILTLVLAFLFVKDGPRFLPWVRVVAGDGAGGHIAEVLRRIWGTLGTFIRQQAQVSLIDAILIGGGLLVVGVPLAVPLAVLTFLGGFIPIVGAIVAGALAVLVALVSNGFSSALIVLAIVVAVQQIEGNVLQPMLQSRSLGLHSAVVLLAVTAGSTLYGIAGAFLAVPAVAAAAVVVRYLGELIDARTAPPEPEPELVEEPPDPVAEPGRDGGAAH